MYVDSLIPSNKQTYETTCGSDTTPTPYCLDPCVSHTALPTPIIYFKMHDFDINNLNTTTTYTTLGDITKFMVFRKPNNTIHEDKSSFDS